MSGFDHAYDYNYNFTPGVEDAVGFALVFVLLFVLILLAVSAVVYVLQSLSLYTIAKRRGIHNPWLSWLPVGNMWILGSISDQYQYVAKGKIRNRRKVLLGTMIATYALMALYYISQFATIIGAAVSGGEAVFASLAITLLLSVCMAVIAIIAAVFQYIAMFDMYKSCDPDNGVLYLVLSILFPISMPVFFFVCRKKDLGMPPRKEVPVQQSAPAVIEPAAPAEEVPTQEVPAEQEEQPAEESTEE